MDIKLIRTVVAIAALAAALPHPTHTHAQDVFDRLQSEQMSIFDYGVKRLRSAALQILPKLQQQGDPRPQSEVSFIPDKREIRVSFFLPSQIEAITPAMCWQRRNQAIRELFFIGSTNYPVPISNEQRVMRRLGAMFTKEPIEVGNTTQATGERLSESTIVRAVIPNPGTTQPIVCEARVSDLRLK